MLHGAGQFQRHSQQNWLPNDHVVVSSTGGTAPSGSLDISLHTGTCTGTLDYTHPTITLAGAASGSTFDTTNTSFKVNAESSTTYVWRIVFTPSAGSFVDGFTNCVENTTMTVADS